MEPQPLDPPRSNPRRPPPFPDRVAESLSYLANLIDESIRVRGTGIGVRDWAAAFLGIEPTELAVTVVDPHPFVAQLMALAVADDLERHAPQAVIGEDQEEPPSWVKLELGEVTSRIPCELAACFGAGDLVLPPVVVQVTQPYRAAGLSFRVFSRREHAPAAEAYLESLRERSRTGTNPFKGRALATVFTQIGLTFKVVPVAATPRADVVLPAPIWAEVDRNVHGLFRALDQLAAAGLACNRGVLLAGPPGTGKTALCRTLAHELAGEVTVVFCDAATVAGGVRSLYEQLRFLAPALVVMEDVDLVVGDRNQGATGSLLEFLVALDGAMSDHTGVVTVATTNDVRAIDPAAKRSARFDVVIDVPQPDPAGRAAILERYLRDLSGVVRIEQVVAVTAGFSGADLRELVSDAVLHLAAEPVPRPVTTELLVRLARARRPAPPTGQYL